MCRRSPFAQGFTRSGTEVVLFPCLTAGSLLLHFWICFIFVSCQKSTRDRCEEPLTGVHFLVSLRYINLEAIRGLCLYEPANHSQTKQAIGWMNDYFVAVCTSVCPTKAMRVELESPAAECLMCGQWGRNYSASLTTKLRPQQAEKLYLVYMWSKGKVYKYNSQ